MARRTQAEFENHRRWLTYDLLCGLVHRRHPLYQRAAALGPTGETLWARRSLHRLGSQQVLVTEVFLPAVVFIAG